MSLYENNYYCIIFSWLKSPLVCPFRWWETQDNCPNCHNIIVHHSKWSYSLVPSCPHAAGRGHLGTRLKWSLDGAKSLMFSCIIPLLCYQQHLLVPFNQLQLYTNLFHRTQLVTGTITIHSTCTFLSIKEHLALYSIYEHSSSLVLCAICSSTVLSCW